MNWFFIVVGLGFAYLGVLQAVLSKGFAQFDERVDAIGSKRSWSEVEPAEWKITLTRIGGVVMISLGVGFVVMGATA